MRKIQNLNTMKKTVLKLEKEISAISNNLSKVKKKDHNTMKKIIHNINYLLTKEQHKNNIYSNEVNHINDIEESKKVEEMNVAKNNQYIHTDESNIDYILIPLNQLNNKSKKEFNPNDPYHTYFNKKNNSSSKIRNTRAISESKSQNYNKIFYDEYNSNPNTNMIINEKIKNTNRNSNTDYYNIINYSNNKTFQKTNQIAYTKPRLMSENTKTNVKNNKRIISSNNNLNINNCINTNNNISLQNEKKEKSSINSLKYLTLNQKNTTNSTENKNPDVIRTINYNYQNKNEDFYNNNKFIYDKQDLSNKEKQKNNYFDKCEKEDSKINKKEYKQEFEKDFFLNKKYIFERKAKTKRNKMSKFETNSKSSNSFNINKFNNNYIDNSRQNKKNIVNYNYTNNKNYLYLSDDNENNNENEINISDKENKKGYENYINPNKNINQNINKNLNDIYGNNINNYKDKKQHKDKEINKINKLFKILNVNNINDALYKVNMLLKYEKYLNKIKDIHNDDKNNINSNDKMFLDKDLIWLSNIIKNYKKNEVYKKYCKNIMMQNKIKNFDEFKNFINNILIKNRKNKGFIVEVKNILCEDEYYSNKNINKKNSEKNMKIEINKKVNNTENSNDIKFTQENDNYKMINEYMNTYE